MFPEGLGCPASWPFFPHHRQLVPRRPTALNPSNTTSEVRATKKPCRSPRAQRDRIQGMGSAPRVIPAMHGFAFYCRALLTLLAVSSSASAGAALDCRYGSYRLADGTLVNVAPDDDDTLRWVKFDAATGVLHKTTTGSWKSTYGWTDRADGLSVSFPEYQHADTPGHQACDTALIDFGGVSGRKVALETKEATFKSHGTLLAGRLVSRRSPSASGSRPSFKTLMANLSPGTCSSATRYTTPIPPSPSSRSMR